jgi:hypothetical protein
MPHLALDRHTRTVVVDLEADAAVVDLQPQGDPGPAGADASQPSPNATTPAGR